LEKIGKYAFHNCVSLQCIFIPHTVKVIDEAAFSGCTQLAHVVLCEGLEHIGKQAFLCCSSLTRIDIPSTTKSIGDEAFCACLKLVHVELSEGLEHIGQKAFCRCDYCVLSSPVLQLRLVMRRLHTARGYKRWSSVMDLSKLGDVHSWTANLSIESEFLLL
jgi:hypothetical protein